MVYLNNKLKKFFYYCIWFIISRGGIGLHLLLICRKKVDAPINFSIAFTFDAVLIAFFSVHSSDPVLLSHAKKSVKLRKKSANLMPPKNVTSKINYQIGTVL